MSNARIILSTVDSLPAAETIAQTLVSEFLASCVNILPGLHSVYRWEGSIHNEKELLLIIKTSSDKTDAALGRLVEIHPYELPEAIALDIRDGYAPYLDWIIAGTSSPGKRIDD